MKTMRACDHMRYSVAEKLLELDNSDLMAVHKTIETIKRRNSPSMNFRIIRDRQIFQKKGYFVYR